MNKKNITIEKFILRLLERKKSLPTNIKKKIENFRYLDTGQIDSLELISFISSIEKKFNFKFKPSELASEKFRFFSGLIKIIEKKNKL